MSKIVSKTLGNFSKCFKHFFSSLDFIEFHAQWKQKTDVFNAAKTWNISS